MIQKPRLLATLMGASLVSLALALPGPHSGPHSSPETNEPATLLEDPIACPYCGGGATLETLVADLGIRCLTRAGQILGGY